MESTNDWIQIPNLRYCTKCKQLFDSGTACLCMATDTGKLQDERGDERMAQWKYPCPFCGQIHLMILGGTVKTDSNGSLIAVCPNQNTKGGD